MIEVGNGNCQRSGRNGNKPDNVTGFDNWASDDPRPDIENRKQAHLANLLAGHPECLFDYRHKDD